jgi:endonuclease/exonuclease/phosphatase family metal-dependent hydrolase
LARLFLLCDVRNVGSHFRQEAEILSQVMHARSFTRILFLALVSFTLAACGKKEAGAPQSQQSASEPESRPAAREKEMPATGRSAAPGFGSLRFISWNLQWFPGRKPETTPEIAAQHMADVRKAVGELKPDVLLLQEVRDWKGAAELCQVVPGMIPHVVTAFDKGVPGGRPQNQVVAATLEADAAWSAKWVGGYYGPPRGYAFAALNAGQGRFILCWSLHLKSNLGEFDQNVSMRAESTRQLIRHIHEMVALFGKQGPCAVVVAGDLNTSSDDPKFAADPTISGLTEAGLYWTHKGVPFANRTTIPGEREFPDNCFDHIFTAGLGQPVAKVRPYPGLSDHYPVIVDVDLAKADFLPKINVPAGIKALAGVAAPSIPVDLPGVLSATDDAAIRAAIGKNVTIRGKVSQVGATKTGTMTFINFEGNSRGQFVVIVKKDFLPGVAAVAGGDVGSLVGKTVEVKGELILYKETPEIDLRTASDIRIVQ